MLQCVTCGCTDFYKESGYFFCTTCQTQSQDAGQEVQLDVPIESNIRLRKIKIRRERSDKREDELGWTSWELYNFVMVGLTNELIQLGASADIKVTVLQLWARYLGKLEVAFVSTKRRLIPKLSRRFKKRDAEIIYGKVLSQKRTRRRRKTDNSATSLAASTFQSQETSLREFNRNKKLMITADYDRFVQSQENAERDAFSTYNTSVSSFQSSSARSCDNTRIQFSCSAKKETRKVENMAKKVPRHKRTRYKQSHVTTQYKTGPELITPMKLWAILYLALRIHNQDIHLGDMIRYGREGHLSYYRLDHLIPPEVTLTRNDVNFLSRVTDITHKGVRRVIGRMAAFLGVTEIIRPDFLSFITRYCRELHLPRGIVLYAERLVALSPPKMKFNGRSCVPNYEGRAMAFIIVVMKTLLGLDGITEYEISKVAAKMNSTMQRQGENFSSPCIFVHGETFDADGLIVEKMIACKTAACIGYQSLLSGAGSVRAVEAALWWLECDEFFNCGYGSVLNEIGDVQMDASIMDGTKLEYGSVAAVSDIEHPISLARYVLDCFPNSTVVGEGAKKLARYAQLDWLSKGDMIAPAACLAHKSEETNEPEPSIESQRAEALKKGGSVGCLAYDGRGIAVGVTSGGSNRKLVGSVSGSSIMGCGAYADRDVGCSLTGHEESIMKLSLSRVIASDIGEKCSPWKALKEHLDYMSSEYNRTGGGVAFKKSGEWSVYFTADRMPYAIIMNDHVTFGTTLDEKNVERFTGDREQFPCTCNFPFVHELVAIDAEHISDTRLFDFREWQGYIECRRAVLVNAHYPTKLKHNPNIPDVNSLYIKFLESARTKTDREEPEIATYKHLIPRDLVHAMRQCITGVEYIDLPLNEVNEFSPSLTPHHSYLQQLLEHPLQDLPSILQRDFSSAKVGYMTKADHVCRLAMQHDISMDIVESNLHFIEKTVPFFEQAKMASARELKDNIEVQDSLEMDARTSEEKESFLEYLHKKIPCQVKIDARKKRYYDSIRNKIDARAPSPRERSSSEFIFDEVLPDGKLPIPVKVADNESWNDDDTYSKDVPKETGLILSKFSQAYDVHFSNTERQALLRDTQRVRKRKRKVLRNAHGKFVKEDSLGVNAKSFLNSQCAESLDGDIGEQIELMLEEEDNVLPEISDILNMNDDVSGRFDDLLKDEMKRPDDEKHREIFKLASNDSRLAPDVELNDNALGLCRPYGDYWMYHCNFGRVKPKNFELFEKTLPRSLRWLLNECASVLEMSTGDLYEEVCLVEAYHACISEQFETGAPSAGGTANRTNINAIRRKW